MNKKSIVDRIHYTHVQESQLFDITLEEVAASFGTALPKHCKGFTVCSLIMDDKKETEILGYAYCSGKDPFSKAKGRLVAKGRAFKTLYKMQHPELYDRKTLKKKESTENVNN